jgi:hypothetical protein
MPITLEITDELFRRLQEHAIPLVDTPISVIERGMELLEGRASKAQSAVIAETPSVEYGTKRLDPFNPPDLFHTRARGTFGESSFSKWNGLVRAAHIEAFKKARSFKELRNVTHAQVREGSHSDSGFKFVPEIGISIQGVDANHAWQYALQLAKYLGQPLRATIGWRHNPKAAYPGDRAVIEWSPL